jgi:hypothetical protein
MFVALQTKNRARVTSIASHWNNRLDELRELTNSGMLICPVCAQQLWLRMGTERRRHFAHRHLTDCPLSRQSAELLEVKGQLFDWLMTKYPDRVNLDLPMDAAKGSRLIDLSVEVEAGAIFAYWVFDRQQRSRGDILAYLHRPNVHVQIIHTQSTLVTHSEAEIALTASQRDFVGLSNYDACLPFRRGGHLHFFDLKESVINIYRGLRCVHTPNLYRWEALRTNVLAVAGVCPETGEIVLAEDVAACEEWDTKQQRGRRTGDETQMGAQGTGPESLGSCPMPEPGFALPSASGQESTSQGPNLNGPFRCEDCGIITTAWSNATPSAGTCVCRGCSHKRWCQA